MKRKSSLIAAVATLLLAGCGGKSSPPPAITVSVKPTSATVQPGSSLVFTATVTNATNTAVNWQVNNIPGGSAKLGTISFSGVYIAPSTEPNPPTVNVQAVSQADPTKAAKALVTIGQPAGTGNRTAQSLPIKLGTSGGNSLDSTPSGTTITCCSGTLGALVERAGTFYILSNNHVLARSDQASKGELITQPGLVDSNCSPATPVANLSQFVSLPQGGSSTSPKTGTVDAAIAQIISGAVDTSGSILELGTASTIPNVPNPAPPASTTVAPAVSMKVAKAGRSSGLTCSTIKYVNNLVDINYSTSCSGGTTFYVQFDNQIVINGGSFSAAGDSGSLVVNSQTAQPVGLLYGGDSTSTVANPIGAVLNAFSGGPLTIVGGAEHPILCPTAATAAPAGAQSTVSVAPAELAKATSIAGSYATRLMVNPQVAGVAVGRSEDAPGRAAVVIYVKSVPPPGTFPPQLDGVRTRIVPVSQAVNKSAARIPAIALSEEEVARATAVKEQWGRQLLESNAAIFGVGVGASADSPGEAVLGVFVSKDASYTPPPVLHGVRIQINRADPFRAWGWNEHEPAGSCLIGIFSRDRQLLRNLKPGKATGYVTE